MNLILSSIGDQLDFLNYNKLVDTTRFLFSDSPKNITKESFWNLALNEYEYDQSLFQQLEKRFYAPRCCFFTWTLFSLYLLCSTDSTKTAPNISSTILDLGVIFNLGKLIIAQHLLNKWFSPLNSVRLLYECFSF